MVDIVSAKVQQVVVFDQLHVDSFTVSQPRIDNPPRRVSLQVGSYGVDENGKRFYSPEIHDAEMSDFNRTLFEDYCVRHGKTPQQAYMTLLTHREVIKEAFQSGEMDELYLMAAFEFAVRKVVEMSGAFDITDIK